MDTPQLAEGRQQIMGILHTGLQETESIAPRGIKQGADNLKLTFSMPKSTISHPSELKRRAPKIATISTSESHPPVVATKTPASKAKPTPAVKKSRPTAVRSLPVSAPKVDRGKTVVSSATTEKSLDNLSVATIRSMVTDQGRQLERVEKAVHDMQGSLAAMKRDFRQISTSVAGLADMSKKMKQLVDATEATRQELKQVKTSLEEPPTSTSSRIAERSAATSRLLDLFERVQQQPMNMSAFRPMELTGKRQFTLMISELIARYHC
jgi:hypothetical protein